MSQERSVALCQSQARDVWGLGKVIPNSVKKKISVESIFHSVEETIFRVLGREPALKVLASIRDSP